MSVNMAGLAVEFCQDLDTVDAADWDVLAGYREPFLSHAFLAGLERYRCVGREFGWYPCHVLLRDAERLLAAMPLYAKANNYGEFVFDWAWSAAWERNGLAYYPKFVSAVPYTPATGPRLLIHPDVERQDRDVLRARLLRAASEFALSHQASGVHVLFPAREEQAFIESLDDPIEVEARFTPANRAVADNDSSMLIDDETADATQTRSHRIDKFVSRHGLQFHWYNANYTDFDAFLATLSSKKRKNIRRERRLAGDSGLKFVWRHGDQIGANEWAVFYQFYVDTFERYSGWPTLSEDFFRETGAALGYRVVLIEAIDPSEPDPARALQAAALCYRSDDALFGRFWGMRDTAAELEGLHFEVCYYQGIEYCIDHGLSRFEPGAQGEHKIPRGFVPTLTTSAHRILTPGFAEPIEAFCERERAMMRTQAEALWKHSPYVFERMSENAANAARELGVIRTGF
ncbi:MAG: GNAT family N-acetyltransferase [Thioalkalivibrionaceae bacterium]